MNAVFKSLGLLTLAIAVMMCVSCSEFIYSNIQEDQSIKCREMESRSDREECEQKSQVSYEEYQHQMKKPEQDK